MMAGRLLRAVQYMQQGAIIPPLLMQRTEHNSLLLVRRTFFRCAFYLCCTRAVVLMQITHLRSMQHAWCVRAMRGSAPPEQ